MNLTYKAPKLDAIINPSKYVKDDEQTLSVYDSLKIQYSSKLLNVTLFLINIIKQLIEKWFNID